MLLCSHVKWMGGAFRFYGFVTEMEASADAYLLGWNCLGFRCATKVCFIVKKPGSWVSVIRGYSALSHMTGVVVY